MQKGFAADVVGSLAASGRGVERAGESRGQDPVIATVGPFVAFHTRQDPYHSDKAFCLDGASPQGNAVAFAQNQRGELRLSEVSPQLTTGGGKPGEGYSAIAFTERTRKAGRTVECQDELAYALTNSASGGRTHSRQIMHNMAVRRLTPRECERLQGFPDDFTRWGITEESKTVEVSDTQRYRQLGNAVTTYVPEWIGNKISNNPLNRTDAG